MSPRLLAFALALVGLAACDKEQPTTQTPDDPGSRMEGSEGSVGATQAATPGAKPEAKPALPTVRDRDPEEEKRKMASSRAQSAKAEEALVGGRNDQAVLAAREALRIHEQNVHAMLIIAEAYYRQKKYEITQAVITSGLAVDPKIRTPSETSRLYNLQGFAFLSMGKEQLATQSFKKAAETDEKNAAAWNNLGARYLEAGDVKTARSCFSYAVDLDSKFYKAHMNLGAAQRAENEWKDAESSFLTALKLRPSYPEAYFNLGILYLDADPFPGLDTTARLNKSISYLTKYRDMTSASATKATGLANKASPPAATREVADDYIRVAKKGIEREQRRIEREKPGAKKPGEAGTDPETASTPDKPGASSPAAAPQKPGGSPAAGTTSTPQKPGATPSPATPSSPQKPAATSTTPAPQKPGAAAPSTPSPQKPGAAPPSAPAPHKPGASPSTPSPQKPAAPAPQKPAAPAPQKPAVTPAPPPPKPGASPQPVAPQKPTPQKPTPQTPSASRATTERDAIAVAHAELHAKKILASRGTRGVDSTLLTRPEGRRRVDAGPNVHGVLGVPDRARGLASRPVPPVPMIKLDRDGSRGGSAHDPDRLPHRSGGAAMAGYVLWRAQGASGCTHDEHVDAASSVVHWT